MKKLAALLFALALPAAQAAQTLTLKEAERLALDKSPRLRSAVLEAEAAGHRADAQRSLEWPRLTLDASYRYVTEVPQLALGPGRELSFGDNGSYAIGPTLQWTAWDFGSLRHSSESFKSLESARKAESSATRRQVLLSLRQTYFKAQLAQEQLMLVGDSLKLAQAQQADIQNRFRAGTSSRIDVLSSRKEVLGLQSQLRQSQAEHTNALLDLGALIEASGRDLSLEALNSDESALPTAERESASHPHVEALEHSSQAAHLASLASTASLWPRISLLARATVEYPNGPLLESVQQNSVALNLTMPLFESSRNRSDAAEKEAQSLSLRHRRDQMDNEFKRDRDKAREQVAALRDQVSLLREAARESTELAKLIYGAYQVGRSGFLEVQSANLRALEAKTQLARNQVQLLIQLAALESLTGPTP